MTKQLNKKGTSLVELIAVIVIMGIIAGIAIPTTIAVINRQKKNAAAKSADSLVSSIKNILIEAAGENSGTLSAEASFGGTTTDTTTFTVKAGTKTLSQFGVDDIQMDNLDATGTLYIEYTTTGGTFNYNVAQHVNTLKINNYTITVASDGSCSAS